MFQTTQVSDPTVFHSSRRKVNLARSLRVIGFVAGTLALSGCNLLREESDKEAGRILGPERLDGAYNGTVDMMTAMNGSITDRENWLGAAVLDLLRKCQAFTARLGLTRGASDLGLDIATLALAGAASVTTPARAANTLAALAGITAGTRAAIDTDVYQQNTAPLIVQQINKTYYPEMKAYLASFPLSNPLVPVEFARISQYHADCSLTMALAQLGNGQSSKPPLTKSDLVNNAVFHAPSGMTVTLGKVGTLQTSATIMPVSGGAGTTTTLHNDELLSLLTGLNATNSN